MLMRNKMINLIQNFNIYFSYKTSLFYIKNVTGVLVIKLPSKFFFNINNKQLSILFLNRFMFKSFLAHFLFKYKQLFFFNFVKLKIKGLGYRIRKIAPNLLRFFFGSTNYFYFHVPFNVIARLKKKRLILVSNNLIILKSLLAHMLLLKKLSVYRIRGLVHTRQIITLKIGKKNL